MIRISDSRLASWFDQIADGLDAGMNASNAVTLAADLPKNASSVLEETFREGKNWAVSLAEAGLSISIAESAIIEASEQSATLPQALRSLAISRRNRAKTKKKMLLAIAYPAFLIHFAAVAFPVSYLVEGRMDAFAVAVGMILVPVWVFAIFFGFVAHFWPRFVRAIMRFLPLFSGYRKNADLGTLCNVLANCFRAGMQVDRAWLAAVAAANSPKLDRLGEAVLKSVNAGQPASEGIKCTKGLVPKSFFQLYKTGEETGTLDQNLSAAGESYISSANSRLTIASIAYPKILLIGIMGYVGYKIVMFYANRMNEIMEISM